MPKSETSCFFLPRRKEGEDPDGPLRHIFVSYEALEGLFHLPIKDAAREIGLRARLNLNRAKPQLFDPAVQDVL